MKKRERDAVSVKQIYAVLESEAYEAEKQVEAESDASTQHGQTGYNMSVSLYNSHSFKQA